MPIYSDMTHSITQFLIVSGVTIGVGIATAGVGAIIGAASCLLGLPPAARMLLKCSCDMILILERSFRYEGRYVSVKQIEDAARYYTTTTIKTFAGNEKRLQQQVHDEIDDLIPLKRLQIGFKFNRLRGNIEDLIYASRFGKPPDYPSSPTNNSSTRLASISAPAELPAPTQRPPVELENTSFTPELPGSEAPTSNSRILSRDSDKVLGSLGDMSLMPRSHRSSTSKTAELEARLAPHAPYSPASDVEGKTLIGSPGATLDGSTLGSQHSSDLSPQPSTKSSTKWSRPSWLRSKKSRNFS